MYTIHNNTCIKCVNKHMYEFINTHMNKFINMMNSLWKVYNDFKGHQVYKDNKGD